MDLEQIWDKYWLEIILIIGTWFFWERMGDFILKKSLTISLVIYALVRLLKDYLWREKYNSPMVVMDDLSESCVKYLNYGKWRIYQLGGIQNIPQELQDPDGIAIVPIESCGQLGQQHYTLCQVQQVNFDMLEPDLKDFVLQTGWTIKKIYLGIFTDIYAQNNPEYLKDFNQYLTDNIFMNGLVEFSRKKITTEMPISDHLATLDKEKGGLLYRFGNNIKSKDKKDEE